ncbi:fibrillin-2-like isoform X2 [Mya arenaria]|uniref:fibrillin-2-like isoform X2 n=1 Tax=Mya arenaria TaxID=6604 RepID=UPI0022E65602|nr:fibrillin-2-like isoform X2 [Mya arenaria]
MHTIRSINMDWIYIYLLPSIIPLFVAAVCNKNECCPGIERDTCKDETKEECLHAKLIHNIHRRFPGYQPQDDEYPLCDYYISPGWYTFCGQVLSSNLTGCGTVFNWIRTESAVDRTNEDSMCTVNENDQRCEGCCANDSECLAINGECVFNVSSNVGECRCQPGSVLRDETCSEVQRCEGCCANDSECLAINGECVFNVSSNVGECRCRPGSVLRDKTCSEIQRCEGCCEDDSECLAINGECVFNVSSNVGECRCRPGSVLRDETCSEVQRCEGCCANDSECLAINGECVFNVSSNVGECRCQPGSVLRDETCSEVQRCEGCCANDRECLAINGECVFNVSSNVGECRCRPGSVLRDETCSEDQRCEGCCANDSECLAINGECVFNVSSNVGECMCRPGSVFRAENCTEAVTSSVDTNSSEYTSATFEGVTTKRIHLLIVILPPCGVIPVAAIIICIICRYKKKTTRNTENRVDVYDEISPDPYTKLEYRNDREKTQTYQGLFVVERSGSKHMHPTKGRLDETSDDHIYAKLELS